MPAIPPDATGTAPNLSRFGQGLGWVYYRVWTRSAVAGPQGQGCGCRCDLANWHSCRALRLATLHLTQVRSPAAPAALQGLHHHHRPAPAGRQQRLLIRRAPQQAAGARSSQAAVWVL